MNDLGTKPKQLSMTLLYVGSLKENTTLFSGWFLSIDLILINDILTYLVKPVLLKGKTGGYSPTGYDITIGVNPPDTAPFKPRGCYQTVFLVFK